MLVRMASRDYMGAMRQYYIEKAERHLGIEWSVEGTGTVRNCLEQLVCSIDSCAGLGIASVSELADGLSDTISLLTSLSGADIPSTGGRASDAADGPFALGVVSGYVAALGLIFAAPVAGVLLPAFGALIAGGLIGGGIGKKRQKKRIEESRKPFLDALYGAADTVDSDIGFYFSMEHFHCARERFEASYRAMAPYRRSSVEEMLGEQLLAGVIDMGEAELRRYLAGILVPADGQ